MDDKTTYTLDDNGVHVNEGGYEHLPGVVQGTVHAKKRGRVKRYFAGLAPAIMAIAIPAAKRFALEAFRTSLKIDGDSGYNSRGQEVLAKVSYRNYYDDPPFSTSSKPARYDYNDISFETRGDAEKVLEQMRNILAHKKVIRVLELYDLCRIPSEHTDYHWGWASLAEVRVVSTLNGRYKLTLPPPMSIN